MFEAVELAFLVRDTAEMNLELAKNLRIYCDQYPCPAIRGELYDSLIHSYVLMLEFVRGMAGQ